MKAYAALAVGVVAGLAVAPITLTANATTTTSAACGDIITEQHDTDALLWRSAKRHDGRPTAHAVTKWRANTLYLQSWARIEGC